MPAALKDLKNEFEERGKPFSRENLTVTAYRVGAIDAGKRGVFLGDKEGTEHYRVLHEDAEVEEYTVNLDNALIAGHQNTVTQLFFDKSYSQVMDELGRRYGSSMEAGRKLDERVMREAKKKGFTGIIYTKPAPPAKIEVVAFDNKSVVPVINKINQMIVLARAIVSKGAEARVRGHA